MLLVRVNWGGTGGFYSIPVEAQQALFDKIGRDAYIKLPKPGTNPRGVEISARALRELVRHTLSRHIEIEWHRTQVEYNPYKRWIDYWKGD